MSRGPDLQRIISGDCVAAFVTQVEIRKYQGRISPFITVDSFYSKPSGNLGMFQYTADRPMGPEYAHLPKQSSFVLYFKVKSDIPPKDNETLVPSKDFFMQNMKHIAYAHIQQTFEAIKQ